MKRFEGLGYKSIYYLNDEKINSMYSQLTGNIESISIQSSHETDIGISAKASNEILRLLGTKLTGELNVGNGSEKTMSITLKREKIEDKFLDIISKIDEQKYKDTFYLIEKYMKETNHIITVGKGIFLPLHFSENEQPKEIVNVKFPMKQQYKGKIVLFSGKVILKNGKSKHAMEPDFNENELENQLKEAIYNDEVEADSLYLSRAFIIMEPESVPNYWGLVNTYDKILYYLGEISRFQGNYFITPYALWGECVIL